VTGLLTVPRRCGFVRAGYAEATRARSDESIGVGFVRAGYAEATRAQSDESVGVGFERTAEAEEPQPQGFELRLVRRGPDSIGTGASSAT
jgi:hypothetical protein